VGLAEVKQKLFIIHGWTYSLDKWTAVCQLLKDRGFEPVQLRVPGLTEPSKKVWDINGYCDWLETQLKGETKPIVIGHSNGGRIALAYAQRHNDRLGKLILIDSAGIAHTQLVSRLKLSILRFLAAITKPLLRSARLKGLLYKLIGAKDYFNASPNMKLTMQNMLAADSTIDLAKVQLPVTIIWGREDGITPLADGHKLAAGIAGAQLHIIANARHAPFANHPDVVAELITKAVRD
jgi:pimeloyl-ACP methyl ester carboxylesterase